jgi:hypothetical protein
MRSIGVRNARGATVHLTFCKRLCTPPVVARVWLYAAPVVPAGKEALVIVNAGGGFTVTVIALLTDMRTASLRLKVTELLLVLVGVPVIAPVLQFKLNPVGSVPEVMVQVYGLVPPDSVSAVL